MDWLKEYYETTGEPGSWPGVSYNPYYIINELKSNDVKDRIIGQVSSTLNITPWLSLLGRAGTDFYTQKVSPFLQTIQITCIVAKAWRPGINAI